MTTITTATTASTVTKEPVTKTQKARKPAEKRGFTEVGKFFAKVRIDLGLTTDEWVKKLGVSNSTVNNIERSDKDFDLAFVRKVFSVLEPHHYLDFAEIMAHKLGVLVIPNSATASQINQAFTILNTDSEELKKVLADAPEAQA